MDEYANVSDVLARILRGANTGGKAESVPVLASYGRIAAEDIQAPEDVPSSAVSHMDGYAVRAEELRQANPEKPSKLKVGESLRPGEKSQNPVVRGSATKVATGAFLPPGADTVVPVEDLVEKDGTIFVSAPPLMGSFVYPQGEDVEKGEVVVTRGHPIRAQDVGLLLALGVESVKVHRKPMVAILATGNELTNRRPRLGEVRNSHSPIFIRIVEALGCVPLDFGISGDDSALVSKKISAALSKSDFVITLGGTSVGKMDVVGSAVSRLRPEDAFHGIKMDRGRVTGIALVGGKPVLMMPGPIQGAMTAFLLLGLPMINHLSGRTRALPMLDCVLGSDWKARKRFDGFVKVFYVSLEDGREIANPIQGDTESVSVLSKADGYIVVPERVTSIPKGNRVEVNLLPGFSFA